MNAEKEQSDSFLGTKTGRLLFFIVFGLCMVGATFQLWLMWLTEIPLGVPGEWVWPRASQQLGSLLDLLPALLSGLLLIGYLCWSTRPLTSRPRTGAWLFGLVLLGIGWTFALHSIIPVGGGTGRSAFVMFYPRTSGYYFQARFEAADLPKFLTEYETEISDADDPENYLHIGTHPPGLTVLNRLLIDLCNQNPKLSDVVNQLRPPAVVAAMQEIERAHLNDGQELTSGDIAALWLMIALSQLCAVLTVVPLYFLTRQIGSISSARLTAGLWLTVPALLVFLPKSDAVFPFLVLLLQWLWINALERNSTIFGVFTGLLFTFAASLSLAFMTVGVILFLQMLAHYSRSRAGLHPTVGGIVAGVACLLLINHFYDVNLFSIWIQNLRNHAHFYDHNTRTYIDWLLINPVEAAVAVGVPLAVCGIVGAGFLLKKNNRDQRWILVGLFIWIVLWLSGKNMGEAARLWLFLMPYAVLAATPFFARLNTSESWILRRFLPMTLLILQTIVCIATAIQIDGFGFTEL